MKKLLSFVLVSTLMVACGQDEEQNQSSDIPESFEPIEVEVQMDEEGEQGEWALEALVTQEDQPVNDANEVTFEVWKQGEKEGSDMIDHEDVNEGVYSVSYTFEEDGIFFVTPHVTARGMHVMPTHEIAIGNVEDEATEGEDHESEAGDHHHSDIVEVESNLGEISQDAEVELTISQEGEALEDARVRLEVWQHGDEMREWIDAEDEGDGQYAASHQFDETGDYHVIIHIENEELHEHLEEAFTIE
ncbi:FixH family protein [Alteribacter populi]|uniref:FixH family protein n=1 Tax=Alteribacter populi TaxID=2011011 RepID=UPI000BBB421A|nr:FixH family protein [Alteribacter populi]